MEKFCGSEFWNLNLTWYTDDPEFTRCFEQTVLVYVPCAFLWLFSGLFLVRKKSRRFSYSYLSLAKILLTLLIIIIQIMDLIHAFYKQGNDYLIFPVDYFTPFIKLSTFTLAMFLIIYGNLHEIQFFFWLLLTISEIPAFRTLIRNFQDGSSIEYFFAITFLSYYPLVVLNFILNCWADFAPLPLSSRTQDANVRPRCPEKRASPLSILFFSWFDKMAWLGYKRPLEMNDLWELNEEERAENLVPIFYKYWNRDNRSQRRDSSFSYQPLNDETTGNVREKKKNNIVLVLCQAFGASFCFGALLKLVSDALIFVGPNIMQLLISHVKSEERNWKGYFFTVLLFTGHFCQTLFLARFFHKMFYIGIRVKTVLTSAIFRKSLVISNAAKKESTTGEIINLISVDVQHLADLIPYLNVIWSSPLQIILASYFLYAQLGPSIFAGIGVMIILVPINLFITARWEKIQYKQMEIKDKRVKFMNEILSGIKVIKLYGWEPSFLKEVTKIRGDEINLLRGVAYFDATLTFLWSSSSFLVSIATFATYVLLDSRNQLDATKAFVSLSLFNIMALPMSFLPYVLSSLVQAKISVGRINKFLNAEEIETKAITHEPNNEDPIVIDNGSFSWGETEEQPILKEISLKIKKGSLVAIVGKVGSGKSSVLSAILGEMKALNGRVNTHGKIAYCSQIAWIQNLTLRDNILFGNNFELLKYNKIIEACALKQDLDMLPAGDKTQIGEKGINLSGGQKQRISLARAVYNDADIYLFDDVLSAVDVHVGEHIFKNVMGPNGMLRKKTRILVTHGVTYLPQMSNIIVLKDGEISEVGNYQGLIDSKGAFSEFLEEHMDNKNGSTSQGGRKKSIRVSETEGDDDEKEETPKDASADDNEDDENNLIEIEKAETGSVKLSVYFYYLKSFGWKLAVISVIFNVLFHVIAAMSNIWLSIWANDTPINGTYSIAKRDMYLGVYGGLGLAQAIVIFFSGLMMALGALQAGVNMHRNMLFSVLRAPINTFFDITPIGRILNRFSKDINGVDSDFPMTLRQFVDCLIFVFSIFGVIIYSTPFFSIVIVPVFFVYLIVQRFYVATSRQLKRIESISKSPIFSHFGETLNGTTTIRAFSVQEKFILESENKIDTNMSSYFPSVVSNRWLATRLETLGNLIIFFSALFVVLSDDINPGLAGLSITYAMNITDYLNWLVRMVSDLETNVVTVERIKEYSELNQEASWENKTREIKKTWPEEGNIRFVNYQIRYREALDLVLKNFNCNILPGEKVGIIGRTGAGKSSLALGLFRIIEADSGSIIIDNEDISQLGLHEIRGRLTIIPQDPVIFSGTLRFNLDPFDNYTDEEIWRSLELAHLKNFVKGLNNCLLFEIQEGGENLSVGQRQLLCLARSLLRKTKILLLDEATASIDLETDALIQKTIRTEFKDSTVLVIAHRLNTIMDSNRVLVLESGEIKEFDSPENLLKNPNSAFYSMARDAGLI